MEVTDYDQHKRLLGALSKDDLNFEKDKKLIEFLTQAGLDEDDIVQVITPSQIEKKLGKEYKSLVDELTIRPKGADTLVRIPDDQLENNKL